MTDFGTMQDRIANEVYQTADATNLSGGLTTAQVQSAIQSAIKHYEREEFWFNQTTGTFATVADQEYYTSSDLADIATLVRIDSMKGTLGSTKLNIEQTTFEKIDDWQNGSVTAFPRHFAYYKENIRLYPIPDDAYTITMAWLKRFSALSADGDTNAWVDDAEELIRQRASADIRINILLDEGARAEARSLFGSGFLSVMEQPAYAALKRETRLRRSNDRLGVDQALVSAGGYDINYQ